MIGVDLSFQKGSNQSSNPRMYDRDLVIACPIYSEKPSAEQLKVT